MLFRIDDAMLLENYIHVHTTKCYTVKALQLSAHSILIRIDSVLATQLRVITKQHSLCTMGPNNLKIHDNNRA